MGKDVGVQRAGRRLFCALTAGVLAISFGLIAINEPSVGVGATTTHTIAPGDSIKLMQSVDTPFVPHKPDIVLVIDRTGSMGPAITDVKSNIAHVVATIQATEPDAQFAAVAYCDSGEATPAFSTLSGLSANASAVIDAVIEMPLCYGGDLPEAQLDALSRIGARGNAIDFRPNSNRIVAWFGDAPGHLRGASLDAAVSSLKEAKARVVAVSVGRNQLNITGQASRITQATGGTLLGGVASDNVAASLLQGVTSLPVEVTAKPECDPGLDVVATARTKTVDSGKAAMFDETVTVAESAAQGSTLTCRVTFRVDGKPMGSDYVQEISITVGSTTTPVEVAPEDPETTTPETADPEPDPEPVVPDPVQPEPEEPPVISPEPSPEPTPVDVPQQEIPVEQTPPPEENPAAP